MSKDTDFDGFDGVMVVIGVIITASAPTLLVALPLALIGGGIHWARRNARMAEWGNDIADRYPMTDYILPALLPGPKDKETGMVIHPTKQKREPSIPETPKTGDTRTGDTRRWSERITQPISVQEHGGVPQSTKLSNIGKDNQAKVSTADNMAQVLALMPKRISYDHPKIPEAPTPTSVLIGYDPIGKRWVWADFGLHGDTIHAFVAGQTRAGKDSQMRLWFTQLTSNNSPEDVQFIIIDAKGEWITPSLLDSRHMAVQPVGGFNLKIEKSENGKRRLRDLANESIEDALINTIELLQARANEFQRVGATNLAAYERKTGKHLPILFVLVTDVGTNLNGILEDLVRFLVLKGGSLGVRAIISMQTASGEDTGWRGQMGLTMSGYQSQSSADAPNLGIPVRAMKYRPSELPSVDVPENRGLFVVRKGIEQYVVRGAYLPDEVFEEYCEVHLPRKSIATNNEFLASMLLDAPEQPVPVVINNKPAVIQPRPILTKQQSLTVAEHAHKGMSTSKIITDVLKITNGNKYKEVRPVVDAIVKAVKAAEAKRAQQ